MPRFPDAFRSSTTVEHYIRNVIKDVAENCEGIGLPVTIVVTVKRRSPENEHDRTVVVDAKFDWA